MQPHLGLTVLGTGRHYPLAPGASVTIGRTADSEIHVDDQAVSRRHCTIEAVGDALLVTDLDSVNGTFVNEQLIDRARALPGDTIRVGATVLNVTGVRAAPRQLESTLSDEATTMSAVVRRRIEPAQFDWLSTLATSAGTDTSDLGLLQRAQGHLSMLHRVSETLASAPDLRSLADATLAAILEETGGDRAAFVLRRNDPLGGGAEIAAARARTPSLETFAVSRTLVGDVIDKGISTFAYDAVNDDRFNAGDSVVGQQVRSVMCVPLRTAGEVLGALYVDSVSAPGRFSETDLELLAALGNQAGVALHRMRLVGELEQLLFDTVRAIAATIDAKDGYTHRHSERVATLAGNLAAELGLDGAAQQTAEFAALLHDVGKIAVPDSILNKPTSLTPDEFEAMKKHPLHGVEILSNIQSPSVTAVLPGVQYHHEHWDGTGYPEGLSGEAIPLLGRLLAVADFFDAITSTRAYRPAVASEDALVMMQERAGTHFDPRVIEALLRLHARGELLQPERDAPVSRRDVMVTSPGKRRE